MSDDALFAAYRAAEYHVAFTEPWLFRVDAYNARLDAELRRLGAARWAYLTAYNPGSKPTPDSQNRLADEALQSELRGRGVTYVRAWSEAPGGAHREEGVLAFDLDEATAVELGARFGQKAVVVGVVGEPARLVSCPG